MSAEIKLFANHSGVTYFICDGCGSHVYSYAKADLDPRCLVCQFVADHPDLPDGAQGLLRGERP